MARSIFGWSYPPGCSGLPWDEEGPCEVCGNVVDNCICPECPECGSYGDPNCYPSHGLHRSFEQKWNWACVNQQWEIEAFAEREGERAMYEEWRKETEDGTSV